MTHSARHALLGIATIVLMPGCFHSLSGYREYASDLPAGAGYSLGALDPGKKVLFDRTAGRCQVAGGEPPEAAILWTVEEANVLPAEGWGKSSVEVLLRDGMRTMLVRAETSAWDSGGCFIPVTEEHGNIASFVGVNLFYAPERPECVRLAGEGPRAVELLADRRARGAAQFEGVAFSNKRVSLKLRGGEGRVSWETASTCFSRTPSPQASADAGGMPLHRCVSERKFGHVVQRCLSTVAMWQGRLDGTSVDLVKTHRSIGPFHLVGGRPSKGAGLIPNAVSIAVMEGETPQSKEVAGGLGSALSADLLRDSTARVVAADDHSATHHIELVVKRTEIGDLTKDETEERSRYQDGTERKSNPDYERAERKVREAERALERAKQEYEDAKVAKSEGHQDCHDTVDTAGNVMDLFGVKGTAKLRKAGNAGCNVVDAVTPVKRKAMDDAEAALQAARSELDRTPEETSVPVYREHTYKKTSYSRSLSATVSLRVSGKELGDQYFSETLTENEVASDPAHNVQGSQVSEAFKNRPESLSPRLLAGIHPIVAKRVRRLIQEGDAAQAARACGESSESAAPELYALAWRVAGGRLRGMLRRDSAYASGQGTVIGAGLQTPGAGECLLLTASADSGEKLSLRSEDRAWEDSRGEGAAFLEFCHSDLHGSKVPAIRVEGPTGSRFVWMAFKTAESNSEAPPPTAFKPTGL